jgi:MSHA biogenesis protein MshJ
MKAWWLLQSARIDALSLRERVFLFLSVLACCLALADVVWLSPAQLAHKQLSLRFDKQNAELLRAREELKTLVKPASTSQAARDEIAALQARLDAANRDIGAATPGPQSTPLAQVLAQLLRRHEGLTLLRTAALAPGAEPAAPRAKVAVTPAALVTAAVAPAAAASAAPADSGVGLTRQGVEVTVAGPYTELTRYLLTLEQALPQIRWGSMSLRSDKQPPELTLQLFLVEVQP